MRQDHKKNTFKVYQTRQKNINNLVHHFSIFPFFRSRDAYINVHVPPEDPFIEDGPVLHVKESVEVKLECVSRGGKPPAKVSNALLELKTFVYKVLTVPHLTLF